MRKWLGRLLDSNEKELKRYQPLVRQINELEAGYERLSNDELRGKTADFKRRLQDGARLEHLLPGAFAAVREAAKRTLGMRAFDVQLLGGAVLHHGKIAEMKTGEGKTLAALFPLYLNSLAGQGCHLVTVNDYLSKRDARWMGPVFHALGVSVGSIQHDASFLYDPDYAPDDSAWSAMRPVSRREAYLADVTYGTNNEFGFDCLRDNMVVDLSRCVQRPLYYAIVDEVDNILIDEARTPLIISGPAEEATQMYQRFARLVPRLRAETDYTIDEKRRSVTLTEEGIVAVERALYRDGVLKSPNLYDQANASLTRYLENALKAQVLFRRDVDYVVRDGQVIIVDEFTGRLMTGRRYSGGLHQAIEAKERVRVQRESMTYATITFQNYFRMYDKLAGMTGTAVTEAEEFHKIYTLDVVVIPTNEPMIRRDADDSVYKDENAKFNAVAREVDEHHQRAQPVLIGTVSIEASEDLSERLKRKGIPHQVLNAKQHEREAGIIAQAGRLKGVTVATNMAGRGVDIVLGGISEGRDEAEWRREHEEVVALGGLHVIGTERHEARRIDNQLRGRSGRQGDPGSSRFYVSLEDDIMRRFGGDRVRNIMEWAGMGEDVPIENRMISRTIENAQVKVEGYNFDIRKHLVEYDDVINTQRGLIYEERSKILRGADLKSNILSMVADEIRSAVSAHMTDDRGEDDPDGLLVEVSAVLSLPPELNGAILGKMRASEIEERLIEHAQAVYEDREKEIGQDNMRTLERLLMLRIMDSLWVEHLTAMDQMRQGIGLQAVGQRDPLVAYKREGHNQFQALMDGIQHDVTHSIFHVSLAREPAGRAAAAPTRTAAGRGAAPAMTASAAQTSAMERAAAASRGGGSAQRTKQRVGGRKVGRNDPCPCGSGRKYKHCCGR